MNIAFIFDRCRRSSAAVAPVKYKCDSNNLRGTFARTKILLTEKLTNGALVTPIPDPSTLFKYYEEQCVPPEAPYFDHSYEYSAKQFLEKYDCGNVATNSLNVLAIDILYREFDIPEIDGIINKLHNNKAPGSDLIPAEFIKFCKNTLTADICKLFNYILEKREFPDLWGEGFRTAVYKSGARLDPNNYRGITILSIFTKMFEMAFHDRLLFICEAYGLIDGGFLKGSMAADNVSLIQRQIIKGEILIVCFVDFSRAFDLINRHILFYKLIKTGLHGRIVDTKCNRSLSPLLATSTGVNQGGNASSCLFRRYLADIGDYLSTSVGVCFEEEILLHLLWADDLLLVSDTTDGLQKQLNGLANFCSQNLMILNEMKTKILVFGKNQYDSNVKDIYFNGKVIHRSQHYKYLGNLLSETQTNQGDIFRYTYGHLCNKARNALFSIEKKLNHLGVLPPKLAIHLFKSNIEPVLTYGCEVWGFHKKGTEAIDTFSLRILKTLLKIKPSTSTIMVYGELGFIPPSVDAHIKILCYYNRLRHLPREKLVRRAFDCLMSLHIGFNTWIGSVKELARRLQFDIEDTSITNFKLTCKNHIRNSFIENWTHQINDIHTNPIVRTYAIFKHSFGFEPYLKQISNTRYRNALTNLRVSSHSLAIERGRHLGTAIQEILCTVCNVIEDEKHFLFECCINEELRFIFNSRVCQLYPQYQYLDSDQKLVFLFEIENEQLITWVGKFVYNSFCLREEYHGKRG